VRALGGDGGCIEGNIDASSGPASAGREIDWMISLVVTHGDQFAPIRQLHASFPRRRDHHFWHSHGRLSVGRQDLT